MSNVDLLKVRPESSILETLQAIDKGVMGIALVVDQEDCLIGTVTDGDIRRAIINHNSLEDPISKIMNKDLVKAHMGLSKYKLITIMKAYGINQIPLVNENNKLVDIKKLSDLLSTDKKTNKLVIMAGGLGTRLKPLTNTTPKPLLPIGNKPILETILEHAELYGIVDIVITLNYLSKYIENYFGNGSLLGVNITYVNEEDSLGTAGAISLIEEPIVDDLFVINGDILTRVNFDLMLKKHKENKNFLTVGTRPYQTQIPYGIINETEEEIKYIEEKPVLEYTINAGIYIISPQAIKEIPKKQFFHMTDLIEKLIAQNKKVGTFLIQDYWLDIGKINDYYKANIEYNDYFF